jgi:hypothetical protein
LWEPLTLAYLTTEDTKGTEAGRLENVMKVFRLFLLIEVVCGWRKARGNAADRAS